MVGGTGKGGTGVSKWFTRLTGQIEVEALPTLQNLAVQPQGLQDKSQWAGVPSKTKCLKF